jgi:hypothetical protein
MPIESPEELQNYLVERLGVQTTQARTVALASTFVNKRFRGGGREVVIFLRNLPPGQMQGLLSEFGYPRIVYDHIYSPSQDRCLPRDNVCCADYSQS